MGYDISYLRIRTTPEADIEALVDAIQEDRNMRFDTCLDGEASVDCTRWSSLTEDMMGISKRFPTTTIEVYVRGEGQDEWVEHFRNGKYFAMSRPDWEPPAFDESKLK